MPPAKSAAENSHGIRGCCFAYQNSPRGEGRFDAHLEIYRDVCDLTPIRLKGSILPECSPTENRCANSLLASNLSTDSADQLTDANCAFKCDVIVTVEFCGHRNGFPIRSNDNKNRIHISIKVKTMRFSHSLE